MPSNLSASAQKVQDALAARGLALTVVELPQSTRTAAEAALASRSPSKAATAFSFTRLAPEVITSTGRLVSAARKMIDLTI